MTCEVDNLYYRGVNRYYLDKPFVYYSARYKKFKTVPIGLYDGATGEFLFISVPDVCPKAWLTHDALCRNPVWDDGSPVTARQAAGVLSSLLRENGHTLRAMLWGFATFIFGCSKAKKNGWF